MARTPVRDDNVSRLNLFAFRVAEDESEMIKRAAEAAGMNVSEWLRGTAISASANLTQTGGAATPNGNTIRAEVLTT